MLCDTDREALAEAVQPTRREAIIAPSPTTCAAALQAAGHLPLRAIRKIVKLRHHTETNLGIALLRDTPLDPVIPRSPKPTRT